MEKAIGSLNPEDRQLIEMHYYWSMKTGDIAEQLHLSQSNVLVRLHRIREKLKVGSINSHRKGTLG